LSKTLHYIPLRHIHFHILRWVFSWVYHFFIGFRIWSFVGNPFSIILVSLAILQTFGQGAYHMNNELHCALLRLPTLVLFNPFNSMIIYITKLFYVRLWISFWF
jgi:hypothetical protein